MTAQPKNQATDSHHAPQFKHPDEMAWEMGRFRMSGDMEN